MNEEFKAAHELAKDPASYSIATYVWVAVLALWGGLVRIVREVKLGDKTAPQIIGIFAAELTVSGFVGVNTFFLCQSSGMGQLYTAVFTSIGSYMGGRALSVLELMWRNRFGGK